MFSCENPFRSGLCPFRRRSAITGYGVTSRRCRAARDVPPALPPLRDRRPRKARAARLASTPRRWTRLGARTALGRAGCASLAGRSLSFRRPRGRGRRSALLNVGPRLAAPVAAHATTAALAARFVPPVFSSSFSGARAKRKRLRIDGLHSPTTQCRYAAQPAKEERKPRVLNERTACLTAPLCAAL